MRQSAEVDSASTRVFRASVAITPPSNLTDQGLHSKKTYAFYATCPKCAKHYGKNWVVLFAQID